MSWAYPYSHSEERITHQGQEVIVDLRHPTGEDEPDWEIYGISFPCGTVQTSMNVIDYLDKIAPKAVEELRDLALAEIAKRGKEVEDTDD